MVSPAAADLPTWEPATPLLPSGANEGDAVVDDQGTVIAVWSENVGSGSVLRAAVQKQGVWGATEDLSPVADGFYASSPRVDIDEAGTATVIWSQLDDDGNGPRTDIIRVRERQRGAAWGPAIDLSEPAEAPREAARADLDVSPSGHISAVWQEYNGTGYGVMSAHRAPGGAWTEASGLTLFTASERRPDVAVDDSGRAVAAWEEGTSPTEIKARVRNAGGVWDTATTINGTPNVNSSEVVVGMAPDGTAHAAWRRTQGGNVALEVASRPDGGSWSAAERVSVFPGASAFDTALSVGADGTVAAAWTQSDGTKLRVRAATRPAGQAWGAAQTLSAAGEDAGRPGLTVDSQGIATVVWARVQGSARKVQAATADPGQPFSSPLDIGDSPDALYGVAVRHSPHGEIVASWNSAGAFAIAKAVRTPICSSVAAAVQGGQSVTVPLTCAGTVNSWAITTPPSLGSLGTVDQAAANVLYTAFAGSAGADQFAFTATNQAGTSATATASLAVSAPVPPPSGGNPPPGDESGANTQPVAGLPVVRFASIVTLPSAKRCVRARRLVLKLRRTGEFGVKSITIAVKGKRKMTVKGAALKRSATLRSLPRGRYKLSVLVALKDGRTLTGSRTYRACR